jgi:hypothetical protein
LHFHLPPLAGLGFALVASVEFSADVFDAFVDPMQLAANAFGAFAVAQSFELAFDIPSFLHQFVLLGHKRLGMPRPFAGFSFFSLSRRASLVRFGVAGRVSATADLPPDVFHSFLDFPQPAAESFGFLSAARAFEFVFDAAAGFAQFTVLAFQLLHPSSSLLPLLPLGVFHRLCFPSLAPFGSFRFRLFTLALASLSKQHVGELAVGYGGQRLVGRFGVGGNVAGGWSQKRGRSDRSQ